MRRLTKLEALRQAQIALLRHDDPAQKRLRRGSKVDRPARPVSEGTKAARPQPKPAARPDVWAAFTLSGDWQ